MTCPITGREVTKAVKQFLGGRVSGVDECGPEVWSLAQLLGRGGVVSSRGSVREVGGTGAQN